MLHPQMIRREGVVTEVTLKRLEFQMNRVDMAVKLSVAVEKFKTVGTLLAVSST